MKHTYIITAILLNITRAGNTPKAVKDYKTDENLAGLEIEHKDIIVDDISVGEVTVANERILAVTYYVDIESDLPAGDVTKAMYDGFTVHVQHDDLVGVNTSAINHSFIS